MATVLKVNWIDRPEADDNSDPDFFIGGSSRQFHWRHSQKEAIEHIEKGVFDYYVEKNARATKLKVGTAANGKKILILDASIGLSQSLLNLPQSSGASGSTAPSR